MSGICFNLSYASLFVLGLASLTSVSLGAVSHILLVIPGIYFLIKFIKEKKEIPPVPLSLWVLLILILVIALSVVFNLDILEKPWKNFAKVKYFVMGVLAVFAFKELFAKEQGRDKRLKVLLHTFIIVTTIASLAGIIGLYTGYTPIKFKAACHPRRACGLFGMYMTYGYGISMFSVLLSGLVIYKDRVKHLISPGLLYLCWVINFAGLFLSYTRGGWIAFFLAVPFYFFKQNKRYFLSFIGIGAVIFAATFVFVPKVKKMFLQRSHSNLQRLAFYETAYKAFLERPLFGWGYKNFEPNVKELKNKYKIAYPTLGGHAHNNFLEHLASTGIIGFFIVILFHLSWLREMYARDDLVALISFPFVINFTISGMFQYTFGDGENLFLVMGIYALTQIKSFNYTYLRNS